MKIAIGADHGGFSLKEEVKDHLQKEGYEVTDFGVHDEQKADYPVIGIRLAEAVAAGEYDCGIAFCGTGIGIGLAANKVEGIRCANVGDVYSAEKAKQHNNANMISLGGRVLGPDLANRIVDAYLQAEFEGGRHARRVQMIMDYEKKRLGH